MSDEAFRNIETGEYIEECRQLYSDKIEQCNQMTEDLPPRERSHPEAFEELFSRLSLEEALEELTRIIEQSPDTGDDQVYMLASSPPKKSSSSPPKKVSGSPKKHLLEPEEQAHCSKSKSSKGGSGGKLKRWMAAKVKEYFHRESHSHGSSEDAHHDIDHIRVNLGMLDLALQNLQDIGEQAASAPELWLRKRVVRALKDAIVEDCRRVAEKIPRIKSAAERELKKRRPSGGKSDQPKDESPLKKHKGWKSKPPGPSTSQDKLKLLKPPDTSTSQGKASTSKVSPMKKSNPNKEGVHLSVMGHDSLKSEGGTTVMTDVYSDDSKSTSQDEGSTGHGSTPKVSPNKKIDPDNNSPKVSPNKKIDPDNNSTT